MHIAKGRSQSEKAIYCKVPTMDILEKQNYRGSKKIIVCQEVGEDRERKG